MNVPHREVRAMTYARKTLVSLNDTAYYHVVARCVRHAWLWGFDKYAGRGFSHRKQWVLERLQLLTTMFAVDVCSLASNPLLVPPAKHTKLRCNTVRAALPFLTGVIEISTCCPVL
jgi:hypothetical protein